MHRGHMHLRHILEPNHMHQRHPQTHNMTTEEEKTEEDMKTEDDIKTEEDEGSSRRYGFDGA